MIQRDPVTGEPTGIFEEKMTLVSGKTPSLSTEQRLAAIRYCNRQYLSKGVTTTIIAGGAGGIVPELLRARERGWLHVRVNAMSTGTRGTPPTLESLVKLSPVPERIRVGADGSYRWLSR